MRFNIAGLIRWVFELPLNDEIGDVGVIRALTRKHGPVVVAVGRSKRTSRVTASFKRRFVSRPPVPKMANAESS